MKNGINIQQMNYLILIKLNQNIYVMQILNLNKINNKQQIFLMIIHIILLMKQINKEKMIMQMNMKKKMIKKIKKINKKINKKIKNKIKIIKIVRKKNFMIVMKKDKNNNKQNKIYSILKNI